jgi:hypothetical protein
MNGFIKVMALLFTVLPVPLGLFTAESGSSPNNQNIAFWITDALQKRLAAQDSHNVIGVATVSNLVPVKIPVREDASIRDDVRFDLASYSLLKGLNIAARVTNGVVPLSGEVNTLYQKEHAADMASRTPGVRDVINGIEVNRIPSLKEEALKDLIKARLSSMGKLMRRLIGLRFLSWAAWSRCPER